MCGQERESVCVWRWGCSHRSILPTVWEQAESGRVSAENNHQDLGTHESSCSLTATCVYNREQEGGQTSHSVTQCCNLPTLLGLSIFLAETLYMASYCTDSRLWKQGYVLWCTKPQKLTQAHHVTLCRHYNTLWPAAFRTIPSRVAHCTVHSTSHKAFISPCIWHKGLLCTKWPTPNSHAMKYSFWSFSLHPYNWD